MTIYVENETDFTFPFDTKELCSRVAEAVLDAEGCPYETEINVLITRASACIIKNTAISTGRRTF